MKKYTFDQTIAVLVTAFMNHTLERSSCHACAVGNLIAHACGISYQTTKHGHKVIDEDETEFSQWYIPFKIPADPDDMAGLTRLRSGVRETPHVILTMKKTGYTIEDLESIEHAFESAPCGFTTEEGMFNGLMAVVDVLAEIHGVDLTVSQDAKAMFVREV